MALLGIITNPNSRKNRGRTDRVAELRELVGSHGRVRQTESTDEVHEVMREFIDAGVTHWISDGGDGTFHWMLNEGYRALEADGRGASTVPVLVPTNGGTIDFVARKAGIRGTPDQILGSLLSAVRAGDELPEVELDTLELVGHVGSEGGRTEPQVVRRLGFAAAVGGVGQRFFAKYYGEPRQGASTILRVIGKAVVGTLAGWGPLRRLPIASESLREYGRHMTAGVHAAVEVDGQTFDYGLLQGLHVGSINVQLGMINLFPHASRAGKMHAVVGEMPVRDLLWKWLYLLRGASVPGGRWHEVPAEHMVIRGRGGDVLDPVVDGEMYYGMERVELRVGPRVRVPVVPT